MDNFGTVVMIVEDGERPHVFIFTDRATWLEAYDKVIAAGKRCDLLTVDTDASWLDELEPIAKQKSLL